MRRGELAPSAGELATWQDLNQRAELVRSEIGEFLLPPRVEPFHSRYVSFIRLPCLPVFGVLATHITVCWAEPVVPGYERLAGSPADAALAGQVLLEELNCLSCHEADDAIAQQVPTKAAPDLSAVGTRITPNYLRKFLFETHAAKPGTTMPDLFHGRAPQQRENEVEALAHFLAAQGGPLAPSKRGGSDRLVERGRELYHSVGCVACHAPEEGGAQIQATIVPLGDLASKTTVDKLSEYLLDPAKIRKAGRMPNFWLAENEAHALAVYLLRDQIKAGGQAVAAQKEFGVEWQYFESPMGDKLPDFEKLSPARTGTHGTITFNMGFKKARQNFAMRWRAIVRIPKDGKWTFFTISDDGSSLLLDGEVIVNNDGVHSRKERSGTIELTAGDHELEVRYFQKVTGAVFGVGWQGPGGRKERIPSSALFIPRGAPMVPLGHEKFVVDQAKAAEGARIFSARGCVSCHPLDGLDPAPATKPFAGLEAGAGCLAEEVPASAPDFDLSNAQRSVLKDVLATGAKGHAPLTPQDMIHRTLATMNCYACHQRGEVGGPDELRRAFFKTRMEIDLGEEGKIPPNLNSVGSKFRKDALEKILYHGELHVRGRFMATRMPGFGKENLEPLVNAFLAADAQPKDAEGPELNYGSARDGQALVGATGLACITCHNVGGRKALGIPGIDLAEMQERLNPGWFKRFLQNPQAFNKDTRMPAFWPGGVASFQKIAGGDPDKQMEGIWNYLSLGQSMPPPPGMAEEGGSGGELKPVLEPIVHRTFMTDVGPRAIVVGFPERVHYAFDANVVRLAKAWRGRFFDASGVASGRSDKFFGPLGEAVIGLPPGPAFALLVSPHDPWPTAGKDDRNVGGRFGGYSLTPNGEPVFLYNLEGYQISEEPKPVMQAGGAILSRSFVVESKEGATRKGLTFIAASGAAIEPREDGSWAVDKKVTIRIKSENQLQPIVREGANGRELVIPLALERGGKQSFEVQIKW